ncbi:MAG: RND family efflux transporter MFP subunit [Oceanicoccus sp.]|jgi:RND family efflux transporter MFP subunit
MKKQLLRIIPSSRPVQIICVALVVMMMLILSRGEKPPVPRQEKAWVVNTIEAQPSAMRPNLELIGQVQSPQDSQLSAGIEAVVSELLVNDGDSVDIGAVLARLDDRDAKLGLIESEADLKEADAQLKLIRLRLKQAESAYKQELKLLALTDSRLTRTKNLVKKNVLSQNDFDKASENLTRQELVVGKAELSMQENDSKKMEMEAKLARLGARREKAALELERATIKAPFNGVVSELNISLGDRVRYGDAILRIQNPEAMEIRAQIPSRYADSLRLSINQGDMVAAKVSLGISTARAQDGLYISGQMIRVSGLTRESSGGVDSFIGFQQAPLGLSLGSTVKIQVELPAVMNVIAVPAEAIYGSNKIYTVVEDRMQMLEVERLGESRLPDGSTQVLIRSSKLSNSEQIIITKLANASDGLRVKVSPPSDQAIATKPSPVNGQQVLRPQQKKSNNG